jgi:hypothetical protein
LYREENIFVHNFANDLPHGGSHLTLISHPDAVTAVIASAICSGTSG